MSKQGSRARSSDSRSEKIQANTGSSRNAAARTRLTSRRSSTPATRVMTAGWVVVMVRFPFGELGRSGDEPVDAEEAGVDADDVAGREAGRAGELRDRGRAERSAEAGRPG